MSDFRSLPVRYSCYPITADCFIAVSNIMTEEYRKISSRHHDKDIMTDDFDGGTLRDFVSNVNPPISVRFSVLSDGLQSVLLPHEFKRQCPDSYERIAVILLIDASEPFLYFSAHLDGSLSLSIAGHSMFDDKSSSMLMKSAGKRIVHLLKDFS